MCGAALAQLALTPSAQACGGLFCNSAQPVNQAAERIIFSENGDGTVTAIIEIQYEGPAASFSWVLPVPGVPDVNVSSTLALDRLQQATNPTYQLNTTFADGCAVPQATSAPGGGAFDQAEGDPAAADDVVVLDSGSVGPFDFEVISVNDELPDPADAALMWLEDNGYDVTALAPEVLGPYLADGLNLIAFRLNKDNDAGSIRPVLLTYDSELPFIPIRPTAVAANPNMGVMVWVVSASRAIPKNYKALELNEALIDWFNPNDTYNDVVSAAADESGGQGFVTEMALPDTRLEQTVLFEWEQQEWSRISSQTYPSAADFVLDASSVFGTWDGFDDALAKTVTLPDGVSIEDFFNCVRCYSDDPGFSADQTMLLQELFDMVYKPVLETENLLMSRGYVTRLYTTMSADEMTLDPIFDFNEDLDDVEMVRVAEQVMDCEGGWHVNLPQGDTVIGEEAGVWPMSLGGDQPAARVIMQLGTSGQGEVLVDNSEVIAGLIGGGTLDEDGTVTLGDDPGGDGDGDGPGDEDGVDGAAGSPAASLTGGDGDDGCGCSAPGGGGGNNAALILFALGYLVMRRRRR